MSVFVYIILLLVDAGLAFIPANMAKNKGYSFGGFWCLGFFVSFLVGIIVAACIPYRNVNARQGYPPQGGYAAYCKACGRPLGPMDGFCPSCGTKADVPQNIPAYNAAYPLQPGVYAPPVSAKSGFMDTYLGFVLLGFLFIVSFILMAAVEAFNLTPMLFQFIYYAAIAIAVALTSRAKGPDFSVGSMMSLSAVIIAVYARSSGSWVLGLILALLICAVIGLINGVLTVFCKAPAILVTLITAAIITGPSYLVTNGMPVQFTGLRQDVLFGLLILIIVFAIAFLMNMFTKIGVPFSRRENVKGGWIYALAYLASGVIAALTGLIYISRTGAAMPALGTGLTLFIIFVFACVIFSRVIDNRTYPVLYSLAPALVWSILSIAFSVLSLNVYTQTVITGVLTLAFTVLAYLARSREFKESLLPR